MDKTAIRNFAIEARKILMKSAITEAGFYGITKDGCKDPVQKGNDFEVYETLAGTENRIFGADIKRRANLAKAVNSQGFEQVIEETAYTWFNRIIAIRFMEINNYLPSRVRVLSSETGSSTPDIITQVSTVDLGLSEFELDAVQTAKRENRYDDAFRFLFIKQCNELNEILPELFKKTDDYMELLLKISYTNDGVIRMLIDSIPEDNFNIEKEGQVEIIGWMYQYYISEKHEEVVDPLHGKVVKKEEVPAATQLFTTDWVVKYLIDNSVGKYWIERNRDSKLADNLMYYVRRNDESVIESNKESIPQEVTVFDPSVGSGHFLVYAFDVLMKIYVEYGFSERDSAVEIVKNNLYGLDIDGRAVQLAYFAVMMKARQYDRRFFSRGVQPHIFEIRESNNVDKQSVDIFCGEDATLKNDINAIVEALKDAKEYGSIIQLPNVDFGRINDRFAQIADEISLYSVYYKNEFRLLMSTAEVMSKKYAVVATNPPYLNKYDAKLKSFVLDKYKDYSGDLFSVFMYRNFEYCLPGGYASFMTPNVWMFIKSYEKLRGYIERNKHISSLVQMAKGAFFKEATVDVCAFVLQNGVYDEKGVFFRLEKFKGDMTVQGKAFLKAIQGEDTSYCFERTLEEFDGIPEKPIAYWVSKSFVDSYTNGRLLSEYGETCQGMSTADNNKYLRLWYEVSKENIFLGCSSEEDSEHSDLVWYPINKGGEYRKWYGNRSYIVRYQHNGKELKKDTHAYVRNAQHYFKPFVTWSKISSGRPSFRFFEEGFTFADAGMSLFCADMTELKYLMAILNSRVSEYELEALSPTMNYEAGHIAKISVIQDEECKKEVCAIVDRNIELMRKHWDETPLSWDFKTSPLIGRDKQSLKECVESFLKEYSDDITELKNNEQKINEVFKRIYHFEDLQCEVDDNSLSLEVPSVQSIISDFIEYAVGCMFGRYSVDVPGLIYAGGEWDSTKYKSYIPDKDAIIPITDEQYFEDDIVGRIEEFVKTVYGAELLEDNLNYIAQVLGTKGATSRDKIRNYFLTDFFKDHCAMYSVTGSGKRPIYWLFDSGKENGFKCLIYIHRYIADTVGLIRSDYLTKTQGMIENALKNAEYAISTSSSAVDKAQATKKRDKYIKQLAEIRAYYPALSHIALQRIELDLDDGVKANYEKFQGIEVSIEGEKKQAVNLLAKI